MKFSVGYQMSNRKFLDDIIKNKEHIEEVFFSFGDFPNGRNIQTQQDIPSFKAMELQLSDLALLNDNGIKFNLLFNGNCYGADSLSRSFFEKVGETTDYIKETFNLSSVTTTSPVIAKFIKSNFADIQTRASVNMNVGSITGMDYISEYFDGYYMKRELNRNFPKIKELSEWCKENGKTLHILANSGCLNNCSAHTFHDNLVAHESEIAKRDNCYDFHGICHEYLKNPEKRISLIRDVSYIRPEDTHLYENYFSSMKLATRVSDKPSLILNSYIRGNYSGNILELLEPNHAPRIYPHAIDNKKLSNENLFCDKNCRECMCCAYTYKKACINIEEWKN